MSRETSMRTCSTCGATCDVDVTAPTDAEIECEDCESSRCDDVYTTTGARRGGPTNRSGGAAEVGTVTAPIGLPEEAIAAAAQQFAVGKPGSWGGMQSAAGRNAAHAYVRPFLLAALPHITAAVAAVVRTFLALHPEGFQYHELLDHLADTTGATGGAPMSAGGGRTPTARARPSDHPDEERTPEQRERDRVEATGDWPDKSWGPFHRHTFSDAIHRDAGPECDQRGTRRRVYVFDPDYLDEYDRFITARARAETAAEVADRFLRDCPDCGAPAPHTPCGYRDGRPTALECGGSPGADEASAGERGTCGASWLIAPERPTP